MVGAHHTAHDPFALAYAHVALFRFENFNEQIVVEVRLAFALMTTTFAKHFPFDSSQKMKTWNVKRECV